MRKANWNEGKAEREREVKITFNCENGQTGEYVMKSKYAKPVKEAIQIFTDLKESKKMGNEDICIVSDILTAIAKKH